MQNEWCDIIPCKREAADVLLRDESGGILLVQNSWNDDWTLPGGALNHGEPPRRGAEREIAEELGLRITVKRLLLVDWESPTETLPIDGLMSLFDGGILDRDQIASIRLQESEIQAYQFCSTNEFPTGLPAHLGRRLHAALIAQEHRTTLYLEDGRQIHR